MIDLIKLIDQPNRDRCLKLWTDNLERFENAPGSSHNHHAWPGGYVDHVSDTMSIARVLYALIVWRGVPFSLSDAYLILFLHDLEKPWRPSPVLVTKAQRAEFRLDLIDSYGIQLTAEQRNALKYVEGEGDDYLSDRRVMNELAAFCHMCDVASARIWHSKEST